MKDSDGIIRLHGEKDSKLLQPGPSAPNGKLEVVITHLQMFERPALGQRSPPNEKLALLRAEKPTLSYYRYLYATVGERWLWYERRVMDDDTLRSHIHHRDVEIVVLYVAGVPAGFFELDRRQPGDVELKYFGLIPEFIGRGLGSYLLDRALERAWAAEPRRVWVNTCTLDHPKAVVVYQRAGFSPFDQEVVYIDDPRVSGAMD